MRTAIWIIGGTFIIFGIIGWLFQTFSPAYVALIGFGVISLIIGYIAPS